MNYKYFLPLFLLLLTLGTRGIAQTGADRTNRIQAVRVSFITDKIKLTPEQSAKFWPVYNQYVSELRNVRGKYKNGLRKNNPNITAEEARNSVDASLEYQQEIVDLKRKFKDRLLQVISPQQLMQLYSAEQEFKSILIKMLGD